MIVIPRTNEQWQALSGFLRYYAKVSPSADMQLFGWVSHDARQQGKLQMVVGIDGFLGKTAQINVANAPGWHFTPKEMLREVFRYCFITAGREVLLGVLNSKNVRAMKYDLHLGFREITRIPGVHEDGGDFVVLAMMKSDCRYIDAQERPHGQEERSAACA